MLLMHGYSRFSSYFPPINQDQRASFKKSLYLLFFSLSLLVLALVLRNFSLFLLGGGLVVTALAFSLKSLENVGIACASLTISLSLADIATSVVIAEPKLDPPPKMNKRRMTDIGYQPNAGVHRSRKITPDGETIYDVKYTIGEDGFRLTQSNDRTSKRVNFFGGSLTFGTGLNDEETLPYFVGQRMKSVKVENFGIGGAGAHQALAILQSKRDTSGQINFFLTAPWHALRSACKVPYSSGSPKYEVRGDYLVKAGRCPENAAWEEFSFLKRVLYHSNLYKWILKAVNRLSVTNEDISLYVAIVREIAKVSHARGQQLIIGFVKADETLFDDNSYSNAHIFDELSKFADAVIDLTLYSKKETSRGINRSLYLHPLDTHPTGLANSKRADMVIELLEKKL